MHYLLWKYVDVSGQLYDL